MSLGVVFRNYTIEGILKNGISGFIVWAMKKYSNVVHQLSKIQCSLGKNLV